ncbi:MAG: hypothetical protein KatS3mg109_0434 [Pirellulaceae bacterium]|nr:MAG: hypothetical protein KatS3mg109_0434 [Pirellulaceae bacterium]
MPRCPYCDAEYTLGEIYCKSCNEDLSALDLPPVSAAPEPPESPSVFTPSPPQTTWPVAAPDDASDLVASADVPEVPLVSQTFVKDEASERAAGPVCPSCGMSNDKDSRFCDRCGKPLGASCPSCDGVNRPGAKFCQHCGQRLDGGPPVATAAPTAASLASHVKTEDPRETYVLVLLSKEGQELARFPLRQGVNQIGAKSPGEGVIPDIDLGGLDKDQVVSRRHAILRVVGEHVTIADCGSTNGTRVNGTKITNTEVTVDEHSNIMFANLHAKLFRV